MLKLASAKLTGLPGESGWAQVHEFTPDEPEKLKLRGHLFAVVATKRVEGGVEVVSSGRELIGRLHEEYFGDLTAKPFNALTSAVEKVINEFKEHWGDVEIAACAVIDDVAFSAAGGGARVVICRDGALATILDSGSEGVVSASGFPKKSDVMMLGTESFFKNIAPGVIKAGLQSPDPESAAETFAPNIHGIADSGNLAAVIVKFDEVVEAAPVNIVTETSPGIAKPNAMLADLKTGVGNFFSGLLKKLPERKIYVREPMNDEVTSQSKKLTFTVAIALLVILAVSIGFGIRQKKINDTKAKYQTILVAAENDVNQAISLASVSPDKSRELFGQSMSELNQITALNVKDPRVEALRKKIDDSKAAILGEYDANPEQFLDLSLLSSGFKGDSLAASAGSVYILDKNGKRIVSVEIPTKKSKVVAGPGVIDAAFDLAAYEGRVFVLGSDGIYEIGTTKNKVIDKSWSGDAFIKAFAGNLYVLDKSGNAIYRFVGNGSTFGEKQSWLSASTKADFSGAVSWTIDGSMYVLYPNSKVLKYSLGSPQTFKVTGVIPEIGSIDAIYADTDNQNVYVLDKAGKRVVVIDKKGQYKAQYTAESIGGATNLVVSESEKKIILLSGDKLFSIDLKNP